MPDQFGLDPGATTLQLVTEFFNTADPVETDGLADDDNGLVDITLKFGRLIMTQGKAFAIPSTNSTGADAGNGVPVYKSWVDADGRKFLVEQVPLVDLADQLDALPLTASVQQPRTNLLAASASPRFPPSQKTPRPSPKAAPAG